MDDIETANYFQCALPACGWEGEAAMIEIANGRCGNCNIDSVKLERNTANHILHFVLTFLTMGVWGIVWVLISIGGEQWHCTLCGSNRVSLPSSSRAFGKLLLVILFCIGAISLSQMVDPSDPVPTSKTTKRRYEKAADRRFEAAKLSAAREEVKEEAKDKWSPEAVEQLRESVVALLNTEKKTQGVGRIHRRTINKLEDLLSIHFERSITNDGKVRLLATDETEGRIVELIDGRQATSATAITTIPYPTSSVPAMQEVMFMGYFAAIVAPEASEEIMAWWGKSIDSGVNRRRTFGSISAECDSIKAADGMIATLTLKIR